MIAIVIVAVLAVLIWVGSGFARRTRTGSPERQLARMLGPDAAERLIRWELSRDPSLSRAKAAQKALERAEYDRGR